MEIEEEEYKMEVKRNRKRKNTFTIFYMRNIPNFRFGSAWPEITSKA